jgi:hypothetical protein
MTLTVRTQLNALFSLPNEGYCYYLAPQEVSVS